MTKEIMKIKNEKALLEYLYKMLSLGYTDGITEQEYFNFINLLEEVVNNDTSKSKKVIKFEKEPFSYTVEKAMKILEKSCIKPRTPLIYSDFDGKAKIMPTYDLRKIELNDYRMFIYPRQIKITNKLMEELIPKIELSDYSWTNSDNLEGAKKVAAIYINELIERYVSERIKAGAWPSDCTDIDKYIFVHDLGNILGEFGTKETFIKAYFHARNIVAEMKDKRALNETIMFSNNSNKTLAYANYLKLVLPKELQFLIKYSHKDYALNDKSIDVFTKGDEAIFKSISCTYSDPSGEWSDTYEREEGIVDRTYVKTMQSRIY